MTPKDRMRMVCVKELWSVDFKIPKWWKVFKVIVTVYRTSNF